MAALTTGGSDLDAFIDDVSIKTVPEPSVISLLVVGLGGLALNRLKSMRESR
ncbi:MAG: PEP-CTERM sorting domain-containing protein [Verrucomicrobiota bacterium]